MPQLAIAAVGAVIGGIGISGSVLTAAGALTAGASWGWLGAPLLGSLLLPDACAEDNECTQTPQPTDDSP